MICADLAANSRRTKSARRHRQSKRREDMRRRFRNSRPVKAGKKTRLSKADTFHHSVYVILLDPLVLQIPAVSRLNPNRIPSKPCVYVGMTGLPVDHRFENHKNGYKSARLVKKYGIKLMPELYQHLNPMPFEAAAQMEKDLTEDLRAEGYTVVAGT